VQGIIKQNWRFSTNISFYFEDGTKNAHMADQYKVVYDLLIGTLFSALERFLTKISRLSQYSTLNISVTVEDRDIVTMNDE